MCSSAEYLDLIEVARERERERERERVPECIIHHFPGTLIPMEMCKLFFLDVMINASKKNNASCTCMLFVVEISTNHFIPYQQLCCNALLRMLPGR